jgi:hypothetical protein
LVGSIKESPGAETPGAQALEERRGARTRLAALHAIVTILRQIYGAPSSDLRAGRQGVKLLGDVLGGLIVRGQRAQEAELNPLRVLPSRVPAACLSRPPSLLAQARAGQRNLRR